MKPIFTALLILAPVAAHAGNPSCHVRQQAVVVPFAHVQQVQVIRTSGLSGFYGTDQYAAQSQARGGDASLADLLAELQEIRGLLAAQGGATRTAAIDPLRLTRQACFKCHNASNAKGGFRVDGELSNDDRLKAMERMLTDDKSARMPKGRDLDAATLGKVLQELGKRSDSPPPPPPSNEAVQVE